MYTANDQAWRCPVPGGTRGPGLLAGDGRHAAHLGNNHERQRRHGRMAAGWIVNDPNVIPLSRSPAGGRVARAAWLAPLFTVSHQGGEPGCQDQPSGRAQFPGTGMRTASLSSPACLITGVSDDVPPRPGRAARWPGGTAGAVASWVLLGCI